MQDFIEVIGARQHNLKNINVKIPRNKLTVITGLSGSGKSSLAFDTIFAEGQRRYVESLSSYARQFLGVMDKPDVDAINGLSPAIAIDQKSASRNPRSTVATVTEIYDYLRLLYARIGKPHCPICHQPVSRQTEENIVKQVLEQFQDRKIIILAPLVKAQKGQFEHLPAEYQKRGYARARVDKIIYSFDEFPELIKTQKHDIELVVDRLVVNQKMSARLATSIEQALLVGRNFVQILDYETEEIITFSLNYACLDHPEVQIPELEPRLFSFNSPMGACTVCAGLGERLEIDPQLVFNNNLTIAEGGIRPYNRVGYDTWYMKKLKAVADNHDFSLKTPIGKLSDQAKQLILYGTGQQKYTLTLNDGRTYQAVFEGIIPNLERRHQETKSEYMRKDIERYMRHKPCHACHGNRLKPEVLAVTISNYNIMDITNLSIAEALKFFNDKLKLTEQEQAIADLIIKEIISRLEFMMSVGLGYLSLGRKANSLSGGEAQRIRLATQIGSGLQGVLYVLDEPSIGLHQRDNDQLIATLKHLRDLGNTVLIVEHDHDTMLNADYLIDVGPGAGEHGGRIVAEGTPQQVMSNPNSLTGKYLSGQKQIQPKKPVRTFKKGNALTIKNINHNNIKNLTVKIPLNLLTVITGVSGSGKSTLINQVLARALKAHFYKAKDVPGQHDKIEGLDKINKAIVIDQSPIGRTPRSNPATYTGIFTTIRDLFASTPEANLRGYTPGKFSFNVAGGRCESCKGDGVKKIEMLFLPDVYVECEECHGKRYKHDVLEIKYKGKNISDVLEMTVDEAKEFFANNYSLSRKLNVLSDVGLGYIRLGQSATTLSGGEAQRIKLATELSRQATGKTFYILDEPTTGLHIDDINRLMHILERLVGDGNSVVVIEHNLDVIKNADYIIDMGPEGGAGGGRIIAEGTPVDIAKCQQSHTGRYLDKIL